MDVDTGEILTEIQTLSAGAAPASTLSRLRELAGMLEYASGRSSKASIAAALTHQAIDYLIEGIEREQNGPEIKRRFAIAIKRAEAWANGQSPFFRPADEPLR